jgi:hypothetical protein
MHGVKCSAPADTLPLLLIGSCWLIMVALKTQVGKGWRRSAVQDLVAQCEERSGNSEVLNAPKFGDRPNSEDVGKHLIVPFHTAGERRRRGGEDVLQALSSYAWSSPLPLRTGVRCGDALVDHISLNLRHQN